MNVWCFVVDHLVGEQATPLHSAAACPKSFSEVSTTGITQLANARKAGFAVSFYMLVLRNITTAIPEAIVVMFVG